MKQYTKILTIFLPLFLFAFLGFLSAQVVDSLGNVILPPFGGMVGDNVDYSNASFESLSNVLYTAALSFANVLLVYLSFFFKGLRNVKFLSGGKTQTRVWIVAGITGLLGFFTKTNGDTSWLNYFLPTLLGVFGSSGLYELIFKKLFGRSKDVATPAA